MYRHTEQISQKPSEQDCSPEVSRELGCVGVKGESHGTLDNESLKGQSERKPWRNFERQIGRGGKGSRLRDSPVTARNGSFTQ